MRKLIQMLASNKDRGSRPKAETNGEEATVYLYDAIGMWGIEAGDFVRDLKAVKASTIHLRINSPGGDVFDARAMKVALEQHPAKVIAHVDGLSASAASFLMMAADEVRIADGAFVMIHNAWGLAIGNAREMRETADLLDKVDGSIVNDYVAKTGKDAEQVGAWMAAETWFTSAEAIDHGFADVLAEKPKVDARLSAFDLTAYSNPPKALTEPPETTFDAMANDRQRYEARLALYERAA
ncbi:head maturation protease, ClpP-related [Caulobacter endophyticus]|uniref:Peptidase S14 n=1 Tax=Caulobacter endophyticus TaxID=2172652 RepID=A0A2T9K3X6_9CAUL|nr:head maturation protease, ClpP-related [Caulobacter endophyticus]PVM90670.1 peptidase S14 [Caulobacter endophyticus]